MQTWESDGKSLSFNLRNGEHFVGFVPVGDDDELYVVTNFGRKYRIIHHLGLDLCDAVEVIDVKRD